MMKKILLLAFTILLTGCSLGQPTKESETKKLENYLEEISWTHEENSPVFINEINGDYEDYPYFDKNYQFNELNTNDLTYTEVYNSFNAENKSNNFFKFDYNYKQDVSNGTYRQTITYNGLEFSYITTYMYDYKNGIKECTKKDSYGNVEECNISGEIMGKQFLKTKQKFLDILEKSEVDKETLLQ